MTSLSIKTPHTPLQWLRQPCRAVDISFTHTPATDPEPLEAYLDRLMPRMASRRAEEAKAVVGDFQVGQRKKLNPPPRRPQASLFPPTADLTPRMTKAMKKTRQ